MDMATSKLTLLDAPGAVVDDSIVATAPAVSTPVVVPPTQVGSPRQPRYLSLDMWRGVACLFVVIHHATMVTWCSQDAISPAGHGRTFGAWCLDLAHVLNIGVPMFFVISGYCIAASADSSRRHQ